MPSRALRHQPSRSQSLLGRPRECRPLLTRYLCGGNAIGHAVSSWSAARAGARSHNGDVEACRSDVYVRHQSRVGQPHVTMHSQANFHTAPSLPRLGPSHTPGEVRRTPSDTKLIAPHVGQATRSHRRLDGLRPARQRHNTRALPQHPTRTPPNQRRDARQRVVARSQVGWYDELTYFCFMIVSFVTPHPRAGGGTPLPPCGGEGRPLLRSQPRPRAPLPLAPLPRGPAPPPCSPRPRWTGKRPWPCCWGALPRCCW